MAVVVGCDKICDGKSAQHGMGWNGREISHTRERELTAWSSVNTVNTNQVGAEENHQGKIVSHNILFAFSGCEISHKTPDDILLTGSQVCWWWNVEIVEGSNLCAGQFEERRRARSPLIGHEEGIGGRFGQDVEYRVAWSQFSPHQPGISPLMRAKYFKFRFRLLPLWKKVVSKQVFTLFHCNFFDISSYTTYWGLLYIQSFQSEVLDWLKGPAKYCRGVFCGVH